jgi:hypothetical protein
MPSRRTIYYWRSEETTVGHYQKLFRDHPPTIFVPFVEQVPIVKGRWNPGKPTATSYARFVWFARRDGPWRVFLIPSRCRRRLTRLDDRGAVRGLHGHRSLLRPKPSSRPALHWGGDAR